MLIMVGVSAIFHVYKGYSVYIWKLMFGEDISNCGSH